MCAKVSFHESEKSTTFCFIVFRISDDVFSGPGTTWRLELSTAIQTRSPSPHTLVLGYANGRGVGYVGLPGGKARGGYEMGEVGTGTDEAGAMLVETAVRLLQER